MKIVIFTSDENSGGIQQFMTAMTKACVSLNHDVICYMPDCCTVPSDIAGIVRKYKKVKNVNLYNKAAKNVSSEINNICPDLVLMPEDAIFSMQVLWHLNPSLHTAFVIHDVTPHPSNLSFRRRLTLKLCFIMRRLGIKKATKIILLSENGINRFKQKYPSFHYKISYMPLSAHVPHYDSLIKPIEIPQSIDDNFALFFGRIDKYKGISNLLEAYKNLKDASPIPLVLAGNGQFSREELYMIENLGVIIINRFVENEEMAWLFNNCKFVVTPYIEASQSGIIPIAYHFGKPVIASSINGLKEFVVNNRTGLLVNSTQELTDALYLFSEQDLKDYSEQCFLFSSSHLCWEKNVNQVIKETINY